jgi:hypothetical protein
MAPLEMEAVIYRTVLISSLPDVTTVLETPVRQASEPVA